MKPSVFQSRLTHTWIALYRPGQYDTFPTWREAFDHAFTIARLRGVVSDAIDRMKSSDG